MDPQNFCEQKLAEIGSSFAYSFRFLTPIAVNPYGSNR